MKLIGRIVMITFNYVVLLILLIVPGLLLVGALVKDAYNGQADSCNVLKGDLSIFDIL